MSYELSGTIKVILDTQTFPSGFTKREFVVKTNDDNYPQEIKFELVKDKCSWLDQWSQGDAVNVHFDIRGNEHKERYYVNLAAWKLDRPAAESNAGGGGGGADEQYGEPPADLAGDGNVSEDPF